MLSTLFDRVVVAVLIFGFPLGVLVGYMWRDRISRARRARYLAPRRYLAERDTQRAGYTDPSIAPDLGVDHHTVAVVRDKLEDGGEIPHHAEVTGRDGIPQPRKKRAKATRKPKVPKAAPS
jgi:hypothetical protein